MVLASPQQPTDNRLLCEGYLKKIRGFGQNRQRWFQVTEAKVSFFTKDGGDLISSVSRRDITDVDDIGGRRFRISTSVPFGQSAAKVMVLESATEEAKTKWLLCLRQRSSESGFRSSEGVLMAEGYLTKSQSLFEGMDRRRWFTLTALEFSYFEREAGSLMGSIHVCDIETVTRQTFTQFEVQANQPFTKSGKDKVLLVCDSASACVRWLKAFSKLLPEDMNGTGFTPLPDNARSASDHYGSFAKRHAPYSGASSQGNRFIDDQLL